MELLKLGVLVSGSGTNLQSILDACQQKGFATVSVVISNVPDAFALKRAEAMGVPTAVVPHKNFPDRDSFDHELITVLKEYDVGLVVLAGFMRILGKGFLRAFPGKVINIHPALLPSFPGVGVRQAAIDYGVRFSGCTVHFVDEGVDTGPVIIQAVVPVYTDDTEEELKHRILKQEHKIYPEAIRLFAEDKIRVEGRKVIILGHAKDESACLINPLLMA